MKRSKFGITASLLLTVVLALGACTKGTGTDNASPSASSSPPSASPSASASASASPSEETKQLSGTININLRGASAEVWKKVADSYTALHPDVKFNIDIKPAEGYRDWLQAQFAAGEPEADFVMNNENAQLMADHKFVDFKPFMEQTNPYTGKAWKESFNLAGMGVNLDDPSLTELNNLNFESVQILWLYNKEIYEKVGIKPPSTFNEMMANFQKLKDAGYTPFAIAGNAQSMWSGQAGWLMRIYPDQYFRDYANQVKSQPGDYTYQPQLDDNWKYDPTDPYNDAKSKMTKNELRMLKAIHEQTGDYKIEGNPAWKAVFENLKKLFSYAPQGFFGMNEEQAYKLFLTSKAATAVALPSSFWQLPKDLADAEKTGGAVKPFEFGYFNMPSMEGELVQAPARTIHIYTGFYSFVKKDAEQTALDIDFMQYVTSPTGYKVYLEAIQNAKDAALNGAPLLNDIELPDEMKKAFESFKAIGNTEGQPSPGNTLARGLSDYQPALQAYVGLVSKYFNDQISADEFLKQFQGNINKYFEPMLKQKKLELSDLEHPERQPPVRQ
ncbi:ABC transporter substrate-binding protein [Cohnella candidum]|uniref:Carbohydrate ABC transporter substrate-binding protein n=1 Tax=Cohnella candidum TaxID=2674991 RepID=A0A3G3JYJ2_9BACL|nr:ABC transporter substrate-binding protein [Cohnella candidum]AYQ72911.1 carbohydrate ABC transporter substrate-binding protein [Cohnella candidum]